MSPEGDTGSFDKESCTSCRESKHAFQQTPHGKISELTTVRYSPAGCTRTGTFCYKTDLCIFWNISFSTKHLLLYSWDKKMAVAFCWRGMYSLKLAYIFLSIVFMHAATATKIPQDEAENPFKSRQTKKLLCQLTPRRVTSFTIIREAVSDTIISPLKTTLSVKQMERPEQAPT